jgi:ABC-2 type transport system permease protein
MFLTLFIMAYGANIFNKVKSEKTNRIVEIISTCVTGRTMMLAKVISVGLMGLTQMLIWGLLISGIIFAFMLILPISIPIEYMFNSRLWIGFMWGIIYFIGGYTFFGSMFAAVGAMSDRNNENQEYITVITLILMGSFYIGMFAIDNVSSSLVQWCSYIPFTSPTVATVATLSGQIPLWQSILSVVILYLSAFITLLGAGKIYTSALLLRGKRLSPRDLLTFLRSK